MKKFFIPIVCVIIEVLFGTSCSVLTADFGVSAILSIVAAAIAAATAIGTGTASAVESDKAELKADTEKAKNDSWFNKEYYQDSLNKKENKDILNELSKAFGNDAKTQGATSNILGISPDTARQMNLQGNEAYSSAVGNIKSNENKFKGSLLDNYQKKDEQFTATKMQAQDQKAKALAGIFTGINTAIGEVAGTATDAGSVAGNTDVNTTGTTEG